MSPDDFADGVIQCLENGANIVGGCCGTTLEHMKALIEKVRA
jgi:5-methyltetrahydrofolate--homocysteine methyltransferase